jgi:hypothetical protein
MVPFSFILLAFIWMREKVSAEKKNLKKLNCAFTNTYCGIDCFISKGGEYSIHTISFSIRNMPFHRWHSLDGLEAPCVFSILRWQLDYVVNAEFLACLDQDSLHRRKVGHVCEGEKVMHGVQPQEDAGGPEWHLRRWGRFYGQH